MCDAACAEITSADGYTDVTATTVPSFISASVEAAFLVWYSTVESVSIFLAFNTEQLPTGSMYINSGVLPRVQGLSAACPLMKTAAGKVDLSRLQADIQVVCSLVSGGC